MKKTVLFGLILCTVLSCSKGETEVNNIKSTTKNNIMEKHIDNNLPTIGILVFEGVIINEVVAPLDVFSNTDPDGKSLFNVVLIAKERKTYSSAHGLKIVPDYTITDVPELKVLVVPSSYHPENQTSDEDLVNFVKSQNQTTDFIASHCAGAFLVGESGIADDKNIVTYVTGGEILQQEYPNLNVADDAEVSVMEDGKFISSNGSLVSYIASLDLLEKLTSLEQRKYVEEYILLNRLREN